MRICWISNIPSPYKVALMNELGKKVELVCLFETRTESDREDSWYDRNFENFKAFYLDAKTQKKLIRECAENCDLLLNSDYSKPIAMYAVYQFHKKHKPTLMHADGGLAIPRGLLDHVISFFMKRNDYFLSSGDEVDRYFAYYGIAKEKVFRYRFACMSENELQKCKEMAENRAYYRKKCGYQEKRILLSIGQQIPRKGYDILAQAMVGIDESTGVYIAGGQPEHIVQEIIDNNKLKNIHFVGFKSKEELFDYYAGADVFVLPTRYDIWGLVINEAMAFGLPIISTDQCVAAVEFGRKFDNSILTPKEDIAGLHNAIKLLSEQKELCSELGERGMQGISMYTYENMSEDLYSIFLKVLNMQTE